jgi:hypothetical protein
MDLRSSLCAGRRIFWAADQSPSGSPQVAASPATQLAPTTPVLNRKRDGMSDEPKKRWRKWSWIGWGTLLLFGLYPLASGPAAMLIDHTDSAFLRRAFHVAYDPLWWIAGCSESATNLLIRYLMWWAPPR